MELYLNEMTETEITKRLLDSEKVYTARDNRGYYKYNPTMGCVCFYKNDRLEIIGAGLDITNCHLYFVVKPTKPLVELGKFYCNVLGQKCFVCDVENGWATYVVEGTKELYNVDKFTGICDGYKNGYNIVKEWKE